MKPNFASAENFPKMALLCLSVLLSVQVKAFDVTGVWLIHGKYRADWVQYEDKVYGIYTYDGFKYYLEGSLSGKNEIIANITRIDLNNNCRVTLRANYQIIDDNSMIGRWKSSNGDCDLTNGQLGGGELKRANETNLPKPNQEIGKLLAKGDDLSGAWAIKDNVGYWFQDKNEVYYLAVLPRYKVYFRGKRQKNIMVGKQLYISRNNECCTVLNIEFNIVDANTFMYSWKCDDKSCDIRQGQKENETAVRYFQLPVSGVTNPPPVVNNQTTSVQQSSTKLGKINWNYVSNNIIVSTDKFLLNACIEVTEPIVDITLMHSGIKKALPRGLVVVPNNTCAIPFKEDVILNEGNNVFKLIVQLKSGQVVSSEPFTIIKSRVRKPGEGTDRIALVIGNGNYMGGNGLKNPPNDAQDMAQSLYNLGFDTIKALNTSRDAFNDALNSFGEKLKNYKVAIFFYAGHGLQIKGDNYLMPVNVSPQTENEAIDKCIPLKKVLDILHDANNLTSVVILDACRNNPLARSWSRGGSTGLAKVEASGTFICYATEPGSTAADGDDKNGTYTSAILKHINTPGISIEDVFREVNSTVVEVTNGMQHPSTTGLTKRRTILKN